MRRTSARHVVEVEQRDIGEIGRQIGPLRQPAEARSGARLGIGMLTVEGVTK
jgi:hypothetical protein